jgi:hypothetical protein
LYPAYLGSGAFFGSNKPAAYAPPPRAAAPNPTLNFDISPVVVPGFKKGFSIALNVFSKKLGCAAGVAANSFSCFLTYLFNSHVASLSSDLFY